MWLSTNNGLIKYSSASKKINKYSIADGLQSNEFIRNSFYNFNNKQFVFGGVNGLSAFNADINLDKHYENNLLITEIEYFSASGNSTNIYLPKTSESNPLVLPPNQHRISFRFAAIDYKQSKNIHYSYKLEGVDKNWKDGNDVRSATFHNLKSGIYTFSILGLNENDEPIGESTSVYFKIKRPYYATPLAFIIYTLLLAVNAYVFYNIFSQRRQIKNELKMEKLEHEKHAQLNELKTKFFMNVSHEFRTPLTVIHGPIERAVETQEFSLKKDEAYSMLRNTKKLIGLLDQLLEFRKIEKGKSKLKLEYFELNNFIKDVIQLFQTVAYEKNISIEFGSENKISIWADKDKIEKVVCNLLSNAIKFTPENGKILLNIEERQNPLNEDINVELSVVDNGVGINEKEINNIFDRFESVGGKGNNPKGIGIGLSLTKELVNLHHGEIKVDSKPNEGSAFSIILPGNKEVFAKDENVEFFEHVEIEEPLQPANEKAENNGKEEIAILVVDDNRDIRKYVAGILSDYQIIEAESVEQAEKLLESHMPNIIVSDVILPGKDGYEFCKQIKSNQHTSHIPVILMTAKGSDDNRVHGLELGADAFIPKPFSAKILMVWVEKLIDSRKKMFDHYMTQIMFSGKKSGEKKSSMKDSFLEEARKIIEKDIANPELSVELLSKAMNMSRSNLHLKFKALINQTPSDFIRIIRLNHAAKLLVDGEHNIVEAAYGSGFNSPSYFTKCFKQFFKKTPTEFIDQYEEE